MFDLMFSRRRFWYPSCISRASTRLCLLAIFCEICERISVKNPRLTLLHTLSALRFSAAITAVCIVTTAAFVFCTWCVTLEISVAIGVVSTEHGISVDIRLSS